MQIALLPSPKPHSQYGGSFSHGKRKVARPFSSTKSLHVVMRASIAQGKVSLLNHQFRVEQIIEEESKRWCVRIYHKAIVSNHIHFLLFCPTKVFFQNFLKSVSGKIAKHIIAEGNLCLSQRFWDETAWTRVIEWGRAFENTRRYVVQNRLETEGVIPYTRRN